MGDNQTTAGTQTPSHASSLDMERIELHWETREEEYLIGLASQARELATRHRQAAAQARKLYNGLGLPGMLLPLIAAAINESLSDYKIAATALMLGSACLSGVNTWLNNGSRAAAHETASAAFEGVAANVEREMAIPKAHRTDCDVAMERVSSAFAAAQGAAPPGL
jgi:hypothetical protein